MASCPTKQQSIQNRKLNRVINIKQFDDVRRVHPKKSGYMSKRTIDKTTTYIQRTMRRLRLSVANKAAIKMTSKLKMCQKHSLQIIIC